MAAMQERREAVDIQPPVSIPGGTRVVPVPDTLALLPQEQSDANEEFRLELARTVIETDVNHSIVLSEPFYLRAGKAWRFWGTAELLRTGEVREGIMARTYQPELDRDPERKGVAVLIKVNKVGGTTNQVRE